MDRCRRVLVLGAVLGVIACGSPAATSSPVATTSTPPTATTVPPTSTIGPVTAPTVIPTDTPEPTQASATVTPAQPTDRPPRPSPPQVAWQPATVANPRGLDARYVDVRDVTDFMVTPDGYLAFGGLELAIEVDFILVGGIWTSADGAAWEAVKPSSDWQDLFFQDALTTPGGILAIATRAEERSAVGEPLDVAVSGSVWRSADGRSWSLLADLPEGSDPRGVEAFDGGLIIGGGYEPGAAAGGCTEGCASGVGVWASADAGVTWQEALAIEDPNLRFRGFAQNAQGALLVATDSDENPRIWTATSAAAWAEVAPTGLTGTELADVIADGGNFLAANLHDASAPVFTSADGVEWAPVTSRNPVLSGIAVLPEFGYAGWNIMLESAGFGFWTSGDAIDWARIPLSPIPTTVISHGSLLLAGGGTGEGMEICDENENCVMSPIWLGTLSAGS